MSSKRNLSGAAVSSTSSNLGGTTKNCESTSPPPNKRAKHVAVVLDSSPTIRPPHGGSNSNNTAGTGFPPPKITTLYDMTGKPVGWTFAQFFFLKDFVKALANKGRALTHQGNTDFKAFTNLSYAFLSGETLLGMNVWVIRIDPKEEGMEGSFPINPMGVAEAWAKKIGRAVSESKALGRAAKSRLTVETHTLTKVEEDSFHTLCAELDCKRLNGWQTAEDEQVMQAAFAPGEYEDLI